MDEEFYIDEELNILCQLLEWAYDVRLGNLRSKIEEIAGIQVRAYFSDTFKDGSSYPFFEIIKTTFNNVAGISIKSVGLYKANVRLGFQESFLALKSMPDNHAKKIISTVYQVIEHLKPGITQEKIKPEQTPIDLPKDAFEVQKGRNQHPYLPFAFHIFIDEHVQEGRRVDTVWVGMALWIDNQVVQDEWVSLYTSSTQTGVIVWPLLERAEGFSKDRFDLTEPGVWAAGTFRGHKLPIKLLRMEPLSIFGQWTDYEG